MKKLCVIVMALAFTLCQTQCRKPVFPDFGGEQTQSIIFTTTEEVSRGNFIQDGGVLKFNWTLTNEHKDLLYVYASDNGTFDASHSEYCGCLVVDKVTVVDGASTATFKGEITLSSELKAKMKGDGTSKMRFIHYGKNVNVTTNGENAGMASVSFTEQYGKLIDSDCLSGETSISSKAVSMLDMNYSTSGKYNGNAMRFLFTIARFSFANFPSSDVLLGRYLKTGLNVSKYGGIEYSDANGETMMLKGKSESYFVVLVPERLYGVSEQADATECVFRGGGKAATGTIRIKQNVFYSASTSTGEAIVITTTDDVPEGAIPYKFSIDANRKVYFSKGNLWYGTVGSSKAKTFNFEDNQREYRNEWDENHVTLFIFRGSGNDNYGTVRNATTAAPTNVNWGENPISNGENKASLWFTLSLNEWKYVGWTRLSGTLFGAGRVYYSATEYTDGAILLPDGWVTPSDLHWSNTVAIGSHNTYTVDEWAKMEKLGAVFLPRAGKRTGNPSTHSDQGVQGNYSTCDKCCMYFGSEFGVTDQVNVNGGGSIRLVTLAVDESNGIFNVDPFDSDDWN